MTNTISELELKWAPDVCTLPSADRPLREREFAELLATAVLSGTRIDAMSASFRLRPEPAVAAKAAGLAVRETGCCSFFTFVLTMADGQLSLAVSVPSAYESILDALVQDVPLTDSAGR
jgi:hypothetical protein